MGKQILVTGGAGFLGSHLCERLLTAGNDVLCVDNFFTGNKDNVAACLGNPHFELIRHDVTFPLYVELDGSFNGKFRDKCLSMEWFLSRAAAKAIIEAWRHHYNEVRPHSSLGYLTLAAFAAKLKNDAAPASATGRDAALNGGFAPRSVATPSLKGQSSEQETLVLST